MEKSYPRGPRPDLAPCSWCGAEMIPLLPKDLGDGWLTWTYIAHCSRCHHERQEVLSAGGRDEQ